MFSSAVSTALLLALLPQAFALTINTPPQLVKGKPALLSWSEGTAPYYLSVYPGGQSSGALKQFDQTSEGSYTWTVDLDPQSVTLGISDSTGTNAYTAPIDIQEGV